MSSLHLRLPRLGRWPRLAMVACCLLLALGSAAQAHAARESTVPTPSGRTVVVAAHDLGAGHLLSAADLAIARLPAALRPRDVLSGRQAAVGRRLAAPLSAREMLTSSRLLGHGLTTGLGSDMVAVPLPIADARVAQLVHVGDRIDILAAGTRESLPVGAAPARATTTTVAAGVRVLAVLADTDEQSGAELVVAADHSMSQQLLRASQSQVLAVVIEPP